MNWSQTSRPTSPPTLYVLIGLPGSGKTNRARELEGQQHALRLTPDEWMIPLFGDNDANGKRDVLEVHIARTKRPSNGDQCHPRLWCLVEERAIRIAIPRIRGWGRLRARIPSY